MFRTRKPTITVLFPATGLFCKCLRPSTPRLFLVLRNWTSSSWMSNGKWQSVISCKPRRAESLGSCKNELDICVCVSTHKQTLSQTCTHSAMTDGPIYHPVMRLHYRPASSCCLATVIFPVVVTAVVAVCSSVSQLLCPGLIEHCFHPPAQETTARLWDPVNCASGKVHSLKEI